LNGAPKTTPWVPILVAAVDSWVDGQGGDVQDVWRYANTIERDSDLVTIAAAALGLKAKQIDGLFITAGAL